MILKFNDPKCKCCPLSAHGFMVGQISSEKDAKGHNTVTPGRPLTLVPGVNVITKAHLDELKKSKIFQHRIENGTYMVDEKIAGDSIVGLSELDAIELVKETLDRDILKKWMIDENRKPVREAIDAQREKVKPEVKAEPKSEKRA